MTPARSSGSAYLLSTMLLLGLWGCSGDNVEVDGKIVFPNGQISFATGTEDVTYWCRDDVDADGDPDYVVSFGADLRVLVNDGRGRFSPGTESLDVGYFIPELSFEYPGDDLPDLLVNTVQGHQVVENQGDGGFALVDDFLIPYENPRALGAIDVEGTGRRAILVADSQGLVVWRDDGAGSLVPERVLTTSWSPVDLWVSDVDGDGRDDVVVYSGGVFFQTWSLILNRPGSFLLESQFNGPGGQTQRTVGDLTGDGRADIVVREVGVGYSIAASDGFGGFTPFVTFAPEVPGATTVPFGRLRVVDLLADGMPDLYIDNLATVLSQAPAGVFTVRRTPELGTSGRGFEFADVDGDEATEVVKFIGPSLVVQRTSADTLLERPIHAELEGTLVYGAPLRSARLRTDGRRSILAFTREGPNQPQSARFYALSFEDGVLRIDDEHDLLALSSGAGCCALSGDFDGDGLEDVCVFTGYAGSTLLFLRGRGDGTLEPPQVRGGVSNYRGLTTGDLDLDGDLDIVAPYAQRVLLNDGAANFTSAFGPTFTQSTYGGADFATAFVELLDADGFPDVTLLEGNGTNPGTIVYGQGMMPLEMIPTFTPTVAISPSSPLPTTPVPNLPVPIVTQWARIDIDDDGVREYVDVTQGLWLDNDGTGRALGAPRSLPGSLRGYGALVGDLDGDGRANDLVTLALSGSRVWYEDLLRPGLVEPRGQSGGATGELLCDLDGDGRDDLVARGGGGLVFVYLNEARR